LDERCMQAIAREMNLSETAFVQPNADGGFDLRWFTPAKEVDLCGHATLASAHILWQEGHLQPDSTASFATQSGSLHCRRGEKNRIVMDFPMEIATPCIPSEDLVKGIGSDGDRYLVNRLHYMVVLRDASTLRALKPDFTRLAHLDRRGVIVTSPSDDGRFDFLSRYFVPKLGINEDPVTGSAHCSLGPYWAERLHKTEMTGYQASSRGGIVGVRVRPDDGRVDLIGDAITVMRTQLLVGA
ncbi:MAG TPA: PhzF family phenazine biosynthesis protein, partial [Phycisphaerales bacterium]|nr:PhzF family phenazine biosynthesis protein [Phycisphaerales bacterium]